MRKNLCEWELVKDDFEMISEAQFFEEYMDKVNLFQI
jgi:hypothetical protein